MDQIEAHRRLHGFFEHGVVALEHKPRAGQFAEHLDGVGRQQHPCRLHPQGWGDAHPNHAVAGHPNVQGEGAGLAHGAGRRFEAQSQGVPFRVARVELAQEFRRFPKRQCRGGAAPSQASGRAHPHHGKHGQASSSEASPCRGRSGRAHGRFNLGFNTASSPPASKARRHASRAASLSPRAHRMSPSCSNATGSPAMPWSCARRIHSKASS